jgi:hypothetical protein
MRVYNFITVAVVLLAACDDGSPTEPDPLEPLRAATEGFQQVDAALAAGYSAAGPCVASPAGGMGFHYVRQAAVDATVELTDPETLLYAPGTGGALQLVGVEYLVPSAAWDASNSSPPAVLGQAFDDHRPEAARHGLPFPHYDLHVWVWKANPAGLHAPFNPDVTCPASSSALHLH